MNNNAIIKKRFTTKDIVLCGILIALTTVLTMLIQIPVIGAHGYVNMSETVILFSALYLGRRHGAVVGSFGAALADIFSGYGVYAPITFITKGLEGYICGLIYEKVSGKKGAILGSITAGVIMVSGYFIGEIFLYGIKTAMAAVPANTMQAIFGIVTALGIFSTLIRTIKNSSAK